jgi:hypothetical protein
MLCTWRAAQDRKIYEGELPAPIERPSPGNSDLGNCGHFALQDGMRCLFPKRKMVQNIDAFLMDLDQRDAAGVDYDLSGDEQHLVDVACDFFGGNVAAAYDAFLVGDSRCYQPKPADWTMAAKLFNNDLALTQSAVRATATLAAGKMPVPINGGVYLAEEEWENEYLTGHTDFRDPDPNVVGDLKTTGKPPKGGWLPTKFLPQMAGYHLLTGCPRVWVLMVDALKAKWANLIWIDFTKPDMQFYAEQVKSFCQFLMSDRLWEVTYPAIGDHCTQTWCRHTVDCYKLFMPPPGRVYNVALRRKVAPKGPVALPTVPLA